MSITGLLRRLGFVAMGIVCLSVVLIVLTVRSPSTPNPDASDQAAEAEVIAPEDDSPPQQAGASSVATQPHTDQPRVPLAIDPPAADPFLELERAGPAAKNTEKATAAQANRPNPAEFDPRETSFENPFIASHWEGEGWTFEPAKMRSHLNPARTTFRRSYRRLMLDATIRPVETPAAPLRLQLLAPATDSKVTFFINAAQISVTASGKGGDRLLEQTLLNPPLTVNKPVVMRIAATGNRLIVHWNHQAVLTCDQPAAQSGRDLLLRILTEQTPYEVTSLRLEGE